MHSIIQNPLLLWLINLVFWICQSGPVQAQSVQAQSVQDITERVYEQHGVVGLAVSLYTQEQGLEQGVAGLRSVRSKAKITPMDHWHIGSCTKAMTAALYADLVQQGRAQWDATVPELFPDLAARMDPAWSKVTARHLFSHRGGVKDLGPTWFLGRVFDEAPLREQRRETVLSLTEKPPKLMIGEFAYSNMGYIMMGAAIERLTDQPWEEALENSLVGVAMGGKGDHHIGFGPPQGDQPRGHRKALWGSKLRPAPQTFDGGDNPPALGPAGTVHANHAAWLGFAKLFIEDGALIPDSLEVLTTPFPSDGDYAMGWGVGNETTLGTRLSHNGSNTMWLARIDVFPDSGAIIMVTTNQFNDAGREAVIDAAQQLTDRIKALKARAE